MALPAGARSEPRTAGEAPCPAERGAGCKALRQEGGGGLGVGVPARLRVREGVDGGKAAEEAGGCVGGEREEAVGHVRLPPVWPVVHEMALGRRARPAAHPALGQRELAPVPLLPRRRLPPQLQPLLARRLRARPPRHAAPPHVPPCAPTARGRGTGGGLGGGLVEKAEGRGAQGAAVCYEVHVRDAPAGLCDRVLLQQIAAAGAAPRRMLCQARSTGNASSARWREQPRRGAAGAAAQPEGTDSAGRDRHRFSYMNIGRVGP
jgi:hypothetical protein